MKKLSLNSWDKLIILLIFLGILFLTDSVLNLSSKNTFKQTNVQKINPLITQAPTPKSAKPTQSSSDNNSPTSTPIPVISPIPTITSNVNRINNINSIQKPRGGEEDDF